MLLQLLLLELLLLLLLELKLTHQGTCRGQVMDVFTLCCDVENKQQFIGIAA